MKDYGCYEGGIPSGIHEERKHVEVEEEVWMVLYGNQVREQ